MRRTLVVMLKTPRPGQVKTRLGRDIGMVSAAWWFRHQSLNVLRRLRDPRWKIVLSLAPDTAVFRDRTWPNDLDRMPQGRGDLGTRMRLALRRAGPGPVCVIGADIPGITKTAVARAFAALGRRQAVFGPAKDGGYWLVGLRHPGRAPRRLFQNVRWSTEHALSDSLRTTAPLSVELVDELSDVDTLADLVATRICR